MPGAGAEFQTRIEAWPTVTGRDLDAFFPVLPLPHHVGTLEKPCRQRTPPATRLTTPIQSMDALPAGFSEVDLESFFERLLPSVSKDSVSTIVALLHHNSEGGASRSHMQPNPPSIVRGRWRWYSKDPEDMAGAEDTVFAHFNDIYTVTTAATRKVLALEPRAVPCTLPQTSHKSKAGKKPRGHYVFDNIASWSFKKSDDDDTVKQVCFMLLFFLVNASP